MRILTIGQPFDLKNGEIPVGWVQMSCSLCNNPLLCRETSAKKFTPTDELVLICTVCIARDDPDLTPFLP